MGFRTLIKSTIQLLPFSDRFTVLNKSKRKGNTMEGYPASWEQKESIWVKRHAMDEIDDVELWLDTASKCSSTVTKVPSTPTNQSMGSSYNESNNQAFKGNFNVSSAKNNYSANSNLNSAKDELDTPFQKSFLELELERRQSDLLLKEYLQEQNAKFDALINNNIDVVIKKQEKTKKANAVKQIIGSVVSEGVNVVSNTVAGTIRLPFSQLPTPAIQTPDLSDTEEDEGEFLVELFIDTLDQKTKIRLLEQLMKEMNEEDDTRKHVKSILKEEQPPKDALDKFQLFMIISIKLFVVGLRVAIPLSQYVYRKFQRNELYLFNKKNTKSLFDLSLKMMEGVVSKLEDHEDVINRVGNIQRRENTEGNFTKLDSIYDEYSKKASKMISEQFNSRILGGNTPTWKRSVIEFVLQRPVREVEYETDPKFSKYYSGQHNERARESWSNSSLGYSSIPGSYRSSRSGSEENLPGKFLRAAELFVDSLA